MTKDVQLFDFTGRPIEPSATARPPDGRVFVYDPTWMRYDLHPSRGLTGPKLEEYFYLASFNGETYWQSRLFADIEEKDWDVSIALQTRKLAVQGLDWEIIKAKSGRAKEVADYCTKALEELNFGDYIFGALDSVGKGFSCVQQVWEAGGVLRHFEHVEAHNFTFRATKIEGENRVPPLPVYAPRGMIIGGGSYVPRLLTREEPVYGLELEPFRWAVHMNKARSGDPSRQGLLRTIGWMYLFKMAGVRNWARFVERFGMPFVMARVDENAWQTDRDKIKQVIRNFGPDGGGVFSRSVELELLEASKSSDEAFLKLIQYFGDAETKVILGQTLTTHSGGMGGTSGGSSRALGQVHQQVRQDILESDCQALGRTIKRDTLTPMVGFKFGWEEPVPGIQFKYEPPQDMELEANVTKTLNDAGWVSDQGEMQALFKRKLTRTTPEEKTQVNIDEQTATDGNAPRRGAATPAKKKTTATAHASETPYQDALDQLAAETLQRTLKPHVLGPMMKPVSAAIARALEHSTTPEEFRASLSALLEEIPAIKSQMDVRHFAGELAGGMTSAMIDGALNTRRGTRA